VFEDLAFSLPELVDRFPEQDFPLHVVVLASGELRVEVLLSLKWPVILFFSRLILVILFGVEGTCFARTWSREQ